MAGLAKITTRLLKNKKLWAAIGIAAFIIGIYLFTFTTSPVRLATPHSSLSLQIRGHLPRQDRRNGVAILPGYNYNPDKPGKYERKTVSLDSRQLADLINGFVQPDIKLRKVVVNIKGSLIRFQLTSSYHFMPGKVSGIITYNYKGSQFHPWQIKKLYLGRVAVPAKKRQIIERNFGPLLDKILANYDVHLITFRIKNGRILTTVDAPPGLIKIENGNIIIDFNALPTPAPSEPPHTL